MKDIEYVTGLLNDLTNLAQMEGMINDDDLTVDQIIAVIREDERNEISKKYGEFSDGCGCCSTNTLNDVMGTKRPDMPMSQRSYTRGLLSSLISSADIPPHMDLRLERKRNVD